MSEYSFGKKHSTVKFEDEYHMRLEAEWTQQKWKVDFTKAQKRFEKTSQKLNKVAEKTREIRGLPSGWAAFEYKIDKDEVVVAFFLGPDSSIFALFRLYFSSKDTERPRKMLKLIVDSLKIHDGETAPWSVFDIDLKLPREFRLAKTSFQAGRKMMAFQWRLRRFFVWHFSPADVLVRNDTVEEWICKFLNASKEIKGARFTVSEAGEVQAERKRLRYPLGHSEEIGRMCFRYKVWCVHDAAANNIRVYLYNYRGEKDLAQIPRVLTAKLMV